MSCTAFSASPKSTKSLFKLSDFWSSMETVIKELWFLKRKNCRIKNVFISRERGSFVTGIPVLKSESAKHARNCGNDRSSVKKGHEALKAWTFCFWKEVWWQLEEALQERGCSPDAPACLEEEIISKQKPRDHWTKEQTNRTILAIKPQSASRRSRERFISIGRAAESSVPLLCFHISSLERSATSALRALTPLVMNGFNLWPVTPAFVIPAG